MNEAATATAHASEAVRKNAIEIRDLNFFYGKFQGLKNVSLDIAERKVTAFIGPSGCGKSTLLRTFNRMYSLYPGQRAEGEIRFYGQNILDARQDLNLLRARIGMVFQKPTPFPMTIYDNKQQRLCIARSVAVKPSVLLLDEPTSALDPISTGKVEELVHELKNDYTIAIVTHNMQQAARCSDYTAYMYLGELIEYGQTQQIFFKPNRTETEDYITGRFG